VGIVSFLPLLATATGRHEGLFCGTLL